MEDFKPTPSEVEETPVKRRHFLRGNFLGSWLEKRDEDDEADDKPKKKEADKADEEKDDRWLPERWRDRFRNIFKSLVSQEVIAPAAAASEVEEPAKDSETADIAAIEQAELAEASETIEKVADREDGLLAVSADARRRYGYELMDGEPDEAEEEVEVDNVETDELVVHERWQVEPIEASAEQPASDSERHQTAPEPVSEVLRRRQAERLEKRVKKLRKQTKSLKREQHEMVDKQKDFVEELDKRQKAQERFEKFTVPKMEADRRKLRERLETTQRELKEVEQEQSERKAVITESSTQKLTVKTEYLPRPETSDKSVAIEAEKQPSDQLDKLLGPSPEQNDLKESVFERRHEVMDEPGSADHQQPVGVAYGSSLMSPVPNVPPLMAPAQFSSPAPVPLPQPTPAIPPDDLYKQAVVAGVGSGVGLTIILLLILILLRY